MKNSKFVSEEQSRKEVRQILPAANLLRLRGLTRVGQLSAAKEKYLQRERQRAAERYGEDSLQAARFQKRAELQQRFSIQNSVQIQRESVAAVPRDDNALIIIGRVTDAKGVGHPDLTVSAIGADGRAIDYTCASTNGSFRLNVPATDGGIATLLVSDSKKAILYRGTEVFQANGGRAVYRELVLDKEAPCTPTPPPEPVPEKVVVPEILGRSQAEAERALKSAGLSAKIETQETDDDQVGRVVQQSPQAGTSVALNSVVIVTIGILRSQVEVPKLVGLTYADARQSLRKARLALGSVTPPRPKPESLVIGQNPEEGSIVEAGSAVDLEFQSEPEVPDVRKVKTPDLVGKTLEEGQVILKRSKLQPGEIRTKAAGPDQAGLILDQSPEAGTTVAERSKVNLVVGEKRDGEPTRKIGRDPVITRAVKDPAFEKISATAEKIQRIAEEQKIRTESAAKKLLKKEDKEIRDTFRLKNLKEAKTLKDIIEKALED